METAMPMLMHSTYFNLGVNNTPDITSAYMAEALEYLSISPGLVSFWIGTRAVDMDRPENDLAFDIAMHQIFRDETSFNLYNSNDTSHQQFVTDVDRWVPSTTRRVMDTYLTHLTFGGNTSAIQDVARDRNFPQSLFHSIYFSLTDKSAGSIAAFTQLCIKYLSAHPGIQQCSTGGLTDIKRDVSVRNFDVGMDLIFESRKAYDEYLLSPGHAAFLSATRPMIKQTYIFDSYLKYQSKTYSLTK
ncbi:Dabb family protein [Arachidicoccus terrestris]|uniref:Dabb family protein n=1 Tax=Arachidicoccus terrestris TaxID=2875539 RepID=UPI001CC65D5E|nr:Dabb family protein [Arachidicoccus terrestris]UAY56184.1 Dabb family protein [Arachidicoccus terrestris]